ncbi:MAG: hypothetical protein HY599_05535 [Candidatus Omnitrophica bacterium]|nr:hypothetical protein [Candidatus Omnitrophota bacterium]
MNSQDRERIPGIKPEHIHSEGPVYLDEEDLQWQHLWPKGFLKTFAVTQSQWEAFMYSLELVRPYQGDREPSVYTGFDFLKGQPFFCSLSPSAEIKALVQKLGTGNKISASLTSLLKNRAEMEPEEIQRRIKTGVAQNVWLRKGIKCAFIRRPLFLKLVRNYQKLKHKK